MCIFCDIIEGKLPTNKVYEDDKVLAILDICQTTEGHTLVMSKKHYDTILDMPSDELSYLIVKTQEIAKMVYKNMECNGMNFLVNTNDIAGQSIMHAHFHIIPRWSENDSVKIEFTENKYDLKEVLSKVKGN